MSVATLSRTPRTITLRRPASRRRSREARPIYVVAKLPAAGMGESYSVRLGPGNIARIQLERRGGGRYFIHWVYVPPTYRGRGLGEILLRRVLRDADRMGVTLSLVAKACGTMDQANLELWYARHGFVPGRLVKLGRTMSRAPRSAEQGRRVA
jgi:GNAT superfamily N-acetyltransferase